MTRALFAAVLSLWLTTSALAGFYEGWAAFERGGYARLVVLSIHWNDPVPFNGARIWAERPLWGASQIFTAMDTAMDKDEIGVIVTRTGPRGVVLRQPWQATWR